MKAKQYNILALTLGVISVLVCLFLLRAPGKYLIFENNIEALANSGEGSGGKDCYRELKADPTESVIYCGTCSDQPGRGKRKSVCFQP